MTHRAVAPGMSFISTKVEEVWIFLDSWGIKDVVFVSQEPDSKEQKSVAKMEIRELSLNLQNLWVSSKPLHSICCQELLFKKTE